MLNELAFYPGPLVPPRADGAPEARPGHCVLGFWTDPGLRALGVEAGMSATDLRWLASSKRSSAWKSGCQRWKRA